MQAVTTYFPYHSLSEDESMLWRKLRRRVKPLFHGLGLGGVISAVAWALAWLL